MDSKTLSQLLLRRVPESVTARSVPMDPHSNTAVSVTYRVKMPMAGNVLGIHLPSLWPAATVLDLRWLTGEGVVVRTLNAGVVPAGALRIMRFWGETGEVLEVVLGISPVQRPRADQISRHLHARPVILIVQPTQT